MTTHHQASNQFAELAELLDDEENYLARRAPVDPERRRRRRRRGLIITASVIVAILAASGGYVAWALTAPVRTPIVASETPPVSVPAAATVTLPTDGAAAISVSGADEYLGATASGIWLTSGTAEPRPIASISKLVTALVILDAYPLAGPDDPGPQITFDKADHDLYDQYYVLGATIAPMPIGTSLSLHDALATMLIPSASNYAEALSTWAFGSQDAFLGAAHDWLASQGLNDTTIVEPTGNSPRNTSTPSDLIALGKLAASNATIAQIAATPSVTLSGPGVLYNTNGMLGSNGITGLKTGTLGQGSYSLLYTASVNVGGATPLSVTGVVLGGHSRESVNASVGATLESIRSGFHDVPVAESGQEVGDFSTPWGSTAKIVLSESASIFTWSDTPITATMKLGTPVTYKSGEVIGTITWTSGPNTVTADVEIKGTISPPTEWWRLTHPSELGAQ